MVQPLKMAKVMVQPTSTVVKLFLMLLMLKVALAPVLALAEELLRQTVIMPYMQEKMEIILMLAVMA